uniref:(northern house mosquito) hypothetical protein n=1 Tax=Culex pipiens TaxID=7175 RepID=A0A8D8AP87_CULPI
METGVRHPLERPATQRRLPAQLAAGRRHLLRSGRDQQVPTTIQAAVSGAVARVQTGRARDHARWQGHHHLLGVQLLRNRLEQGRLPEAGPPAGHALCHVHGGGVQNAQANLPPTSRPGRELGPP